MNYTFDFLLDHPIPAGSLQRPPGHDRTDRGRRGVRRRAGHRVRLGARAGAEMAASRSSSAYVELIRNTPFLIQLFFIFFGLPSMGVQLSEMQARDAHHGHQPRCL